MQVPNAVHGATPIAAAKQEDSKSYGKVILGGFAGMGVGAATLGVLADCLTTKRARAVPDIAITGAVIGFTALGAYIGWRMSANDSPSLRTITTSNANESHALLQARPDIKAEFNAQQLRLKPDVAPDIAGGLLSWLDANNDNKVNVKTERGATQPMMGRDVTYDMRKTLERIDRETNSDGQLTEQELRDHLFPAVDNPPPSLTLRAKGDTFDTVVKLGGATMVTDAESYVWTYGNDTSSPLD